MTSTTARTPAFPSKLPNVGTTIFTVMSALATETGAVNLGQGFPDFNCDPALVDAVSSAMQAGLNQYPPMPGVPVLREAISKKIEALYGRHYDAGSEITVTAGATQAIITAILAVVHPGDEVIVLEPCYDSYVPNIELAGGVAVRVPLTPGSFRPDFGAIAAAITPRTRAILINSPHNPSATIWTAEEMRQFEDLLAPTDILLISLPPIGQRVCLVISHGLMLFCTWLLFSGALSQARINWDVEAPVTGASVAIFYASGVVFAVASGLLLLLNLWRLLSGQVRDDQLVRIAGTEDLATIGGLHLDRTNTTK